MDARKNIRVSFNMTANFKYENKTLTGEIEDLSTKGLYLITDQKISKDKKISVTINLSGATSKLTIDVEGIVVRNDSKGIAITFQEMDLDSFIHLRNIVAYNSIDQEKIIKEFIDSMPDNSIRD